jgi:hypothetical protein
LFWWIVRSHFKHSVELVDDNAEIVDQLAGIEDFMLAKATPHPREDRQDGKASRDRDV